MAPHALPAGSSLHEYRVEKLLGVGGFGLTYLALDQNLNLRVALKEYLPSDIALRAEGQSIAPTSPAAADSFQWGKQRFLDESRTLASFRHPNIVRVMRFFEANGSAYMVMEFVEGCALNDWIEPRRPLAEAQLTRLVVPLLDGLEVVHQAGYLHRDIKPGNIYVRADDSPVLLDFGSARQRSSELTAVVSPGYAPFEQYHTTGNQGPWSDLYALSGVLYWIVTGSRPAEAAARVREDSMLPALRAGDRNRFRPEFLAAIDWALTPFEEQRPQTVAEWRSALFGTAAVPANAASRERPPELKKTVIAFRPELLQRLESALAEHIGPIAKVVVRNAAKKCASQAELLGVLAAEIEDDAARTSFEKGFVEISRPQSSPQPRTAGHSQSAEPATVLAASRFPLELLERAERRLAEHIGAVAQVVVKRAAMKARDEAELYMLIAEQIDDKERRKAFIRKAASSTRKP